MQKHKVVTNCKSSKYSYVNMCTYKSQNEQSTICVHKRDQLNVLPAFRHPVQASNYRIEKTAKISHKSLVVHYVSFNFYFLFSFTNCMSIAHDALYWMWLEQERTTDTNGQTLLLLNVLYTLCGHQNWSWKYLSSKQWDLSLPFMKTFCFTIVNVKMLIQTSVFHNTKHTLTSKIPVFNLRNMKL